MNFLKDFIIAFAIGILLFLVYVILMYSNSNSFPSVNRALSYFLVNQLYAVSLYFVNAYYFRVILKWKLKQTFLIKNLLIGGTGGVLLTLVSIYILNGLVEILLFGNDFSVFIAKQKLKSYLMPLIISIVITSVFYIIYYNKNKQYFKVTQQKIIAGTESAKFEALKNQLDPHFLFNSLNVLSSLIEEDSETAGKFTHSLSKVYRYVLEQKDKELVTLEEELAFAKEYLSLMLVRFEDSIAFDIPKELTNPEAKIVPLALQLLLENAIKHNRLSPEEKLVIRIEEKDACLIVTNNVQPKQIWNKGTGLGLKNIQDRYALFTYKAVSIHQTKDQFQVEIPLLSSEIKLAHYKNKSKQEGTYTEAVKYVAKLRGFYLHLMIYLCFVIVFSYLNLTQSKQYFWAIYPILGWGFGVFSHAVDVFGWRLFFSKTWEEKIIKKYMDKYKDS